MVTLLKRENIYMRRMINFTPVSYGEYEQEEGGFLLDNPLKPGFYVMIVTNPEGEINTFTMSINENINSYSTICKTEADNNSLNYFLANEPYYLYSQNGFGAGSTVECIRLF